MIMIVFRLIYKNYPSFNCAPLKMYLTAVKKVSKMASCSSPTDGAQIMSNDTLLSTSDFL